VVRYARGLPAASVRLWIRMPLPLTPHPQAGLQREHHGGEIPLNPPRPHGERLASLSSAGDPLRAFFVREPVLCRCASAAQRASGHDPGVPAFVDDHFAVDNDIADADRELLGLGTCGRGFDALRIEHHDIGLEAIA
jgi:hypothetical protein